MARLALQHAHEHWIDIDAQIAWCDERIACHVRAPAGDFAGASAQVSGRFPPAVKGVLFRNGPAIHDMGGLRYQHWFDGDGMVQRYAITATGVNHRGKVVCAPKFVAEQAPGHERALEPYDLAAVEREAARIRPLDAVAEFSSSPCAHRSWSATLPTMQRYTRR